MAAHPAPPFLLIQWSDMPPVWKRYLLYATLSVDNIQEHEDLSFSAPVKPLIGVVSLSLRQRMCPGFYKGQAPLSSLSREKAMPKKAEPLRSQSPCLPEGDRFWAMHHSKPSPSRPQMGRAQDHVDAPKIDGFDPARLETWAWKLTGTNYEAPSELPGIA